MQSEGVWKWKGNDIVQEPSLHEGSASDSYNFMIDETSVHSFNFLCAPAISDFTYSRMSLDFGFLSATTTTKTSGYLSVTSTKFISSVDGLLFSSVKLTHGLSAIDCTTFMGYNAIWSRSTHFNCSYHWECRLSQFLAITTTFGGSINCRGCNRSNKTQEALTLLSLSKYWNCCALSLSQSDPWYVAFIRNFSLNWLADWVFRCCAFVSL